MVVTLPPSPMLTLLPARPSLIAYVWHGDKFDEIGTAATQGFGHVLHLALGALKTDVIELRARDPDFYPHGQAADGRTPTFRAFIAGTTQQAGTVWAHPDGLGHRLKLRQDLADGTTIELRPAAPAETAKPRRPVRRRAAAPSQH